MKKDSYRSFVFAFLTSIWLLGITTPPILQLMEENTPLISFNMNEEESQEQGKKDIGEEIILTNPLGFNDMLIYSYSDSASNNHRHLFNTYFGEIQLPPPEQIL